MIPMAMRKERANKRTQTYRTEVQGNVVRKIYVEPPYHQEEQPRPEKVHHRKHKQNALSIPYCIFLAAACVVTLLICANYLQLQAVNANNQKNITSLEGQLAEMKKDNADALNAIQSSINLEEIRRIAIEEMGMVYATEENVILYKNNSRNYVSQYEEIPQEEQSSLKSVLESE